MFMPSFSFLPPVVQKIQVKIHKSTENTKNLLFKPEALYNIMINKDFWEAAVD